MTVAPKYLEHMIRLALPARMSAYAPYSKYLVSAVLFVRFENSQTGKFFVGVNIENASYGLTICAERVAIFSAIAAYDGMYGVDEVYDSMVVLTKDGSTSCGACLQVMLEFNPSMDLIFVNDQGKIVEQAMVKDLLRSSFTKENLNE